MIHCIPELDSPVPALEVAGAILELGADVCKGHIAHTLDADSVVSEHGDAKVCGVALNQPKCCCTFDLDRRTILESETEVFV